MVRATKNIKTAKVQSGSQNKKGVSAKKSGAKKLLIQVFDIDGKRQGTFALPKEFFGQKPNRQLLAQAVRVYFANRSFHKASTKTRAEIRGGGAKPWRQKGTGRARAGSIRSPLWVGGGAIFGPRPRDTRLTLPKKMKKRALISALSIKSLDGNIKIISNFDKLESKTRIAQDLLSKLNISGKTLIVLEESKQNVNLAVRNIPDINTETADNLNAYKVLISKNLLFSKGAIEKFR